METPSDARLADEESRPAAAAQHPPDHHRSVLLDEVLEALQPHGGIGFTAVDCTTNGGGHTAALLERSSPDGRVLGLDADTSALALARVRLAPFDGRFVLAQCNFRDLPRAAAEHGFGGGVHAVIADLGLSSVQLDLSGRGFSFQGDEPLDMRFDEAAGTATAADLLNTLDEAELAALFREYGEEPRARRLASVVIRRRERAPFARTGDLVAAAMQALGPRRGRTHPATRVFQALRVKVNDELGALDAMLDAALAALHPGGRLAVITFHSLEDRLVKWRFRGWAQPEEGVPTARILTRKPIVPSDAEVRHNPRARSAKLRVVERLAPHVEVPA
ncbi:MAG: 16S rRNA (cytosine(1402)-N(4))-methyltransferase RsmH [Chloroflexi bacterium]|nr:16S rRNA (cytosine(1402)-N(4))-methyltransferase RsmH [Chloroflexota bacterium]